MSKRKIELTDTELFMNGLLRALVSDPKNNDSVQVFRECLSRIRALKKENKDRLFRAIVENGLTNLRVKLPQEECAMNGHQFTDWEEAEYVETECCEDLTGRNGEEVCKPWELPDGMRTFITQQTTKTRYERFCRHCFKYEYSYVKPENIEELGSKEEASLARRVRALETKDQE